MMNTVKDILDVKGFGVATIDPNRTVFEAIQLMDALEIGSLVVTRNGDVLGMLTERDYLKKVALLGRTSRKTRVRDIMSSPAVTAGPDTLIDDCLRVMTEARARQIPVLREGRLVGLISVGDAVKWYVQQQDDHIDSLVRYVQSGSALSEASSPPA